ncbi:hypothetical protein N3K66_004772 [Trichothecium roseum]|uniref:Uncharacterized protein n=1 Tax=Trichothecium roseum TaxID=47278 RepID=A0ACC0V281_9HYPO|nr:hypothetical protein N3K66_004772 [Trichothecium roseum]
MDPEAVEDLLTRQGSGVTPDEYDDLNETDEVIEERTKALDRVLATCRALWDNGSENAKTEELAVVAQKLGDGSRDVGWRIPFGASGIFGFFLGVIGVEDLDQGLYLHALRLVGNSCADTDENRARMVENDRMQAVVRRMSDESLVPVCIPVLYNSIVDYEPAQLYASQIQLSKSLVELLSKPSITEYAPIVNYFCKILALLISQDGEASRASPSTVQVLLDLASQEPFKDDVEDFTSLVSVAAAYLGSEPFQTDIVTKDGLHLFLSIYHHVHTGFGDVDDPGAEAALKQLRAGLLNSLADISGHDAFPAHHPLESSVPQTLLAWLKGANPALRTAACIAVGNLSRSDQASTDLVQKYSAHEPLIAVVADPATSDQQILHAVLSFLKNLAIPAANKPLLGGLLDPTCLPRMYALDTSPQVQFSAVSLTRLLITNCPENARRICKTSAGSGGGDGDGDDATIADSIVSLFSRSDAEPTRMESARSILALCRALHSGSPEVVLQDWDTDSSTTTTTTSTSSSSSASSYEEKRGAFYQKHAFSKPLSFLVAQEKWPTMRSEALFVLALMCRSKDGSKVVLSILDEDDGNNMKVITELVTGQKATETETAAAEQIEAGHEENQQDGSSVDDVTALTTKLQLEPQQVDPRQQATMSKVDRENCLVLVTELLRHRGGDRDGDMPEARRALLRELVKRALAT